MWEIDPILVFTRHNINNFKMTIADLFCLRFVASAKTLNGHMPGQTSQQLADHEVGETYYNRASWY